MFVSEFVVSLLDSLSSQQGPLKFENCASPLPSSALEIYWIFDSDSYA